MAVAVAPSTLACDTPVSVCTEAQESRPATIVSAASADPAVQHVAESFSADLKRVSGHAAPRTENIQQVQGRAVVIGVLGQSPMIDRLVKSGKLNPGNLSVQWEGYRQVVIDNPWPNVSRLWSSSGPTAGERCTARTTSRRKSESRPDTGLPTFLSNVNPTCTSRPAIGPIIPT